MVKGQQQGISHKIDPTITPSTNFESAYVKQSSPDTTFDGSNTLEVGNNTDGEELGYLKFNLPVLSASDMVTNSKLMLNSSSVSKTSLINLYQVTDPWSTSSITYNSQKTLGKTSTAEDYTQTSSDISVSWDITRLTKDWYVNGNNNGILLKSTADSGLTKFISSTYRPCITIQYINSAGLESYWSYHSTDVGRAGTIYTNDYNGNVVAVHDDVSLSGNRMPISIKHVYNTNNDDIGYGYGWRLNYDQTLIKTTLDGAPSNTIYYAYTDGDGTIHYFPCVSGAVTMKDDSGLNLTLLVNSDKTYTIRDKNWNTWNFNSDGKLISLTDSLLIHKSTDYSTSNHQNILTIDHDPDGKIASITDGSGRKISLAYNAGHLASITDLDNRTTSFSYNDSNQLTSITYPDSDPNISTSSTYTYNTDNSLNTVTNYDHHSLSITYTNGSIHRVYNVQEKGVDPTSGNPANGEAYTITYGDNVTSFLDAKNRTQIYQFNNSGNTTNVQNGDGSGQFFQYDTSSDALPNKLVMQSKLQTSVTNLLVDPSIERNNGTDWKMGTHGDPTKETATVYSGTTYSHYGSKSLKLTNNDGGSGPYFDQTIALSPGKTYTLSAFVKTINVSNTNHKGAQLNVYYSGSSGLNGTSSNFVTGSIDWQRIFLTFSLPNDAASNTVTIEPILNSEIGTAYFDDFQLEEGEICDRYNLIENGDFSSYDTSNNPNYWTKSTYCTPNDTVTTDTGNHPVQLDNNVFTISGDAKKAKSISKRITLNCGSGDILVIGAWAKADSAPIVEGSSRLFDIELQFDALTDKKIVKFNPGCKDWQYVTDVIKPPGCSQITITLNYSYNINSASFDGIQLYKESYGKSYAYDSNGNLTSAVDLANQTKTFAYTNNDLTDYTDALGNHFSYGVSTFDHKLSSSQSAAGVQQLFPYDINGNTTKITIGSSPSTAAITTTATYTPDGNYIASITDPLGNTVSKTYNPNNGNLENVKDAYLNLKNYQYDKLGRLTNTNSVSVDKTDSTNNTNANYTYENDQLKTISANGVTYNFGYDPLGRNNSVSVGDQNLITNNYENTTGNLLSSSYGNNQTVEQDYDNLNRITGQKYNGSYLFHYEYDDSGNLAYFQDLENGVNYNYIYDFAKRLVLVKDSNGNSISYTYDKDSNVSTLTDTLGNATYTTSYSYDADSRIKNVTTSTGVVVATAYDSLGLGRIASKKINNNYTTTYTYVGSGTAGTSKVIASITNGSKTLNYTYDKNGNIKTISDGSNTISYTYNALNELTREDNQVLNNTIVYAYDQGGNIQSKALYPYSPNTPTESLGTAPSTINYSYDTTWKDKLTSYNGSGITYDKIGNPLTFSGYNLTWERGKEQATLNGNGLTISYKYDSNGIRTQKTVNGTITNYHLIGDKVTFEDNGTDSVYYTYDPNGKLVSMNLNGTEYFYVRNAQGDIISLVDKTGTPVASYVYDTWGKLVSIKDGNGNDVTNVTTSVGYKNPYRYRGYRYDTETGLYYCNSRYYNPEWGRFINADSLAGKTGKLLSHNLFAYCNNNPVNKADSNGFDAIWITDSAAVAGAGHTSLLLQDENKEWSYFYWGPNKSAPIYTSKVIIQKVGKALPDLSNLASEVGYSGTYDRSVYINGDFSNSVKYAQWLSDHPYLRGLYNVASRNCMQVSIEVLNAGTYDGGFLQDKADSVFMSLIGNSEAPNLATDAVEKYFGNSNY
jgi:RHS repeat-associated core domain